MLSYTIRRILSGIPTLVIIITVAFFMMRLTPGGPFDGERPVPPQIEKNLLAAYHLDEPIWAQYIRYVGDILKGDLGPSFKYHEFSVSDLIWSSLPVSVQVGGIAILFAILIGTSFGMLAALRQNSKTDHGIMGIAMFGITIPNFVVAPTLTLFLGVYLGWFPVGGWGGFEYAVLPIITLALPQIAYISRLTRASMLEVMRSNYIRTAYAKGLPERTVVLRHALKGTMLPVVSYLGPATAAILTGSVVIEKIFSIPGVGRYFVQGALNRDYTLVMGVIIVYSVLIIILNTLVDLIYGYMDPKIKLR